MNVAITTNCRKRGMVHVDAGINDPNNHPLSHRTANTTAGRAFPHGVGAYPSGTGVAGWQQCRAAHYLLYSWPTGHYLSLILTE